MRLFIDFKLKVKTYNKRVGTFSQARLQGMTIEEAREYTDRLIPPTAEDIAYEKKYCQENKNGSM
jgi:hypothetical protein